MMQLLLPMLRRLLLLLLLADAQPHLLGMGPYVPSSRDRYRRCVRGVPTCAHAHRKTVVAMHRIIQTVCIKMEKGESASKVAQTGARKPDNPLCPAPFAPAVGCKAVYTPPPFSYASGSSVL